MRRRITILAAGGALAALGIASQAPESVWDGIYTEEQAQRGEPLYEANCTECHGPELEGGEMGSPLAGSDFMWAWNELTVGDLYERLRVSMPEAAPRSMTDQEKADVLAYILAANEIPPGDLELAPKTTALKPIAFHAVKP